MRCKDAPYVGAIVRSTRTTIDRSGSSLEALPFYHEAEESMPCMRHPNSTHGCKLPEAGSVDILSICPPCQPFSQLRGNRLEKTPKQHELFNTVFGEQGPLKSLTRRLLPRVIIGEEMRFLFFVFEVRR